MIASTLPAPGEDVRAGKDARTRIIDMLDRIWPEHAGDDVAIAEHFTIDTFAHAMPALTHAVAEYTMNYAEHGCTYTLYDGRVMTLRCVPAGDAEGIYVQLIGADAQSPNPDTILCTAHHIRRRDDVKDLYAEIVGFTRSTPMPIEYS